MSILTEYKSCVNILGNLQTIIESDDYINMSDIDRRLINEQLLHLQSVIGVIQMRMGRMGIEIPT